MSRAATTLAAAALAALAASPAHAQQASAAASRSASPAVEAIAGSYRGVQRNLLASAEQIPDSAYAWRPNDNVRSVGQLFAHIANAHNMGCAAALGEPSPANENYEKTRTTKAAITEALRTSFALCDRAFAQSDAAAMGSTKLFGGDRSRLSALTFVAMHDWEHYGNLVTYMRLLGMVPPSSQ